MGGEGREEKREEKRRKEKRNRKNKMSRELSRIIPELVFFHLIIKTFSIIFTVQGVGLY